MNSALILHDKEVGRSGPETQYDFDKQWYGPVSQAIQDQTGAHVAIPELPHPTRARFADYAKIIDGCSIDEDSMVIGHGFGAGIALRYFSQRPDIRPNQVALVAPRFLRTGEERKFFYDTPDAALSQRIGEVSLLYSEDTSVNGIRSARRIERLFNEAQVQRLQGYGKCIVGNSMQSPDFPELLDAIGISTSETGQVASNVIPIQRARGRAETDVTASVGRLDRAARLT